MIGIHQQFVKEEYGADGILSQFDVFAPEDYNFAYDCVDAIAAAEPDRPAMLWCNPEGEEHKFTFGDMKYWSDKCANMLVANGIKQGDFVLVILRRHYQFWFAALALNKIGAVLVPATFMLKEHDLEYRINAAEISALIATDAGEIAGVVDAAEAKCPSLTKKFLVAAGGGGLTDGAELEQAKAGLTLIGPTLSGPSGVCQLKAAEGGLTPSTQTAKLPWIDFNAAVLAASDQWSKQPTLCSDPTIMYFSSGTSGNPKMVLHDSLYSLGHLGTAKHWQNVKSDGGLHWTIADTGWGKAVWGKYYGQWLMEAQVFTYDYDRFSAAEVCDLIDKYQISTLCMPPTMYRILMTSGEAEKHDLSSLIYSVTAGEALNPDLFEWWKEYTASRPNNPTELKITEGFGQTETPVTIANLVGMEPKAGSMGKPVPLYETKLLNADGTESASGQTGEICIRYEGKHPGLMCEYYRNPERTQQAIYDGWYHTGDEAWADEDGYYWYVGRNDDVIKSSGYRIGPFEIESVLLEHPAVAEAAVTGVPDELRGKAVKATIVLATGYAQSAELTKEIQNFVKEQTAPYKYPRIIDYVDALPKTVNGKVRRAVIRDADEQKAASFTRPPEEFGG